MRSKSDVVLYVGKASNLRNRLRSYFSNSHKPDPKVRRLVKLIADFDFIVTESEQEALILECNLIKEYQPRFNSRLKDDKSYPFIKIDTSETLLMSVFMLKYIIELILMIQKLWLKLTAQTDQLLQKIVGTTKTMKKIVQTALILNLQNLT